MNIFVLSTGRCGSKGFATACSHIENLSSGHETRTSILGQGRLNYPNDHIEVDNRLCWFLGRLDEKFGNSAFYVHLKRNEKDVAKSLNRRWHLRENIIRAYSDQIHMTTVRNPLVACEDYIRTVNSNISTFLKTKDNTMEIHIEKIRSDFPDFWRRINAKGDLDRALEEFPTRHNRGGKIGIDYSPTSDPTETSIQE